MGNMDDRLRDQVEDILEAQELKELWTKYQESLESGDWKQAHDRLQEITLRLLDKTTKKLAEAREYKDWVNVAIKELSQRYEGLIAKYQEIVEGFQRREAERGGPAEKTGRAGAGRGCRRLARALKRIIF